VGSQQDGWISAHEAARRLGCDIDTVRTIAENGAIKWIGEGQKLFFRSGDVDEVCRLSGGAEMSQDESRRRLVFLERKVARLEEALELMLKVNNMSSSRLDPMDDDTIMLLFQNITDSLQEEEWSIPRLLSCCEVFIRISEPEIERLNELFERNDSWRPLLELCLKQLRYVTTHDEFPVDINFQRCFELLGVGRQNLRSMAVIFIELHRLEGTSNDMLAGLAAADVDAFDAVVRQFKSRKSKDLL